MPTKIALLDWDGTIRTDFTIRSWIRFLILKGLVSSNAADDVDAVLRAYAQEQISHDDAAVKTSQLYAACLKSCRKQDVVNAVAEYMSEDRRYLTPFARTLFQGLAARHIHAVVISGAPGIVIQQYLDEFSISAVHALELEAVDGAFSGEISINPGTSWSKQNLVRAFVESPSYSIVLAAGNSRSDLPLLQHARATIVVDNPTLCTQTQRCLQITSTDADSTQILALLEELPASARSEPQ